MERAWNKAAWNWHFQELSSGHDVAHRDGVYALKASPQPKDKEKEVVTVIDPVESQVNQAEQELKEQEVQYQQITRGVKYNSPSDARKPPSKRQKSVAIAPPTDALDKI